MVDLKPENDIYCAECHLTFARAEPRVIIAGKTYHQSCSVKYEASSEHPQDVLASAAQAIVPAIGRLVSKSESTKPSTADDKQHASELRKKAAKAERTVAKELGARPAKSKRKVASRQAPDRGWQKPKTGKQQVAKQKLSPRKSHAAIRNAHRK